MHVEENKSLKPFNTFGLEAIASHYTEIHNEEDVVTLCREVLPNYKNHLILGGGSNILLTADYNGLVVKNCLLGITVLEENDQHVVVKACAGENWHEFVLHCLDNNFFGLENLSLIPGCVGASPMQNIGAYGVEIKDHVERVEAYHIYEQKFREFWVEDCRFGYRDSIFKQEGKGKYIITSVTYKLSKHPDIKTTYGAITQELETMGINNPTPKDVSNAVIRIRQSKLPDPAEIGNSGSFFKNPVIDEAHYHQLKEQFPDMPGYNQEDGVKVPAGWLIESLGWKGKRFGDAGVHAKQALVLVNYGHATGAEIFDLSTRILESVKEKYGIDLEREVNII